MSHYLLQYTINSYIAINNDSVLRSLRSCASSPVSKEIHQNEEIDVHYRDVEATPAYALPGNSSSVDDDSHSKTPVRRKGSPIFRTPYLENLSNSEHENISSVRI